MTSVALNRLSNNDNGFILQIEGGKVDHAAHSNDIAGLLFDQISFDDAIGTVLDFVDGRDDTLVIITSDHGNANPGLNGASDANAMFDSIAEFKYTNSWILSELNDTSSVNQVRERVEEATRHQIKRSEAEALISSLKREYKTLYEPRNGASAVIGTMLANYTSVNWIGGAHTSDYVELATMGPGSQALTNFTRNTDLFKLMVDAAGVEESYWYNCPKTSE